MWQRTATTTKILEGRKKKEDDSEGIEGRKEISFVNSWFLKTIPSCLSNLLDLHPDFRSSPCTFLCCLFDVQEASPCKQLQVSDAFHGDVSTG